MKVLFLFFAAVSLLLWSMPPARGEPKRRTEARIAVPRGVTQYLDPRLQAQEKSRQLFRGEDEATPSIVPAVRTSSSPNTREKDINGKRPSFADSTPSGSSASSASEKPAANKASTPKPRTSSQPKAKNQTTARKKSTGKRETRAPSTDPDNPMTRLDEIEQSDASTYESSMPYGLPVPGKAGLVYSPFDSTGYVDVKGMPAGSKARCPYSHKIFRVP